MDVILFKMHSGQINLLDCWHKLQLTCRQKLQIVNILMFVLFLYQMMLKFDNYL